MKKLALAQDMTTKLIKSYITNTYDFPNSCRFGFLLSLIESIFIGIFYYLSIYLVDTLHIDIPTTGVIISCYGIGAIFGGIIGGRLSDLTSPGVICTISLFIQAVSYFLFTIVASPILLMHLKQLTIDPSSQTRYNLPCNFLAD